MKSRIVHSSVSSSKNQAATDTVRGRLRYTLFAAEMHNERANHPRWLFTKSVDSIQGLWYGMPTFHSTDWDGHLGLRDGRSRIQKIATLQIGNIRECWVLLVEVFTSVKSILPESSFLRSNGLDSARQCQTPEEGRGEREVQNQARVSGTQPCSCITKTSISADKTCSLLPELKMFAYGHLTHLPQQGK